MAGPHAALSAKQTLALVPARLPARLARDLHAGLPFSLLCLANNCGIGATFAAMQHRFQQLYRRRLYTHHYEAYIELPEFDAALEAAAWLTDSYQQLDETSQPPDLARLRPQDSGSFGQNSLRQGQGRPGAAAAAGAAGRGGR